MLTVRDIEDLIETMYDRQIARLLASPFSMETFLSDRVEQDVTLEIREYEKVLESLRTIAVPK